MFTSGLIVQYQLLYIVNYDLILLNCRSHEQPNELLKGKWNDVMNIHFPPITVSNVSLLLAVGAIILLITTEMISPYYGLNLTVNRKRMQNAAFTVGVLFLVSVIILVIKTIMFSKAF